MTLLSSHDDDNVASLDTNCTNRDPEPNGFELIVFYNQEERYEMGMGMDVSHSINIYMKIKCQLQSSGKNLTINQNASHYERFRSILIVTLQ